MKDNVTYFFHLRDHVLVQTDVSDFDYDILPKGGVTVAFQYNQRSIGGVIIWAASYCSPEDHFVKRIGRVKAEGRLKSKLAYQFHVDNDITVEGVITLIKVEVYKSREVTMMFDPNYLF